MREDIFEFKLNGQMSDGQTVVFLQSITNVLQSILQKKLSLWWKMVLLEVKTLSGTNLYIKIVTYQLTQVTINRHNDRNVMFIHLESGHNFILVHQTTQTAINIKIPNCSFNENRSIHLINWQRIQNSSKTKKLCCI